MRIASPIIDIQPRFAAFMGSRAASDFAAFNTTKNRGDFMAWIGGCKRTAPPAAVADGRIIDHEAFTAHCWQVARDDIMRGAA